MRNFVQAVIIGILTGGVYALMASGQTLIFGIMKVINLAQGAMVIVGAFLSYSLFVHLGIDPFLSILITTPPLFGIGVLIQLAFLRPLRVTMRPRFVCLSRSLSRWESRAFSPSPTRRTTASITPSYANCLDLAGYEFSAVRLFAFIPSLVLLVALSLLLNRTS